MIVPTKSPVRRLGAVAVALFALTLVPHIALADTAARPTEIRSPNTQISSARESDPQAFEVWRRSLAEERALLERQSARQYDAIEKLIERSLWLFGTLFTVTLGAFFWFFGKTKLEFQRSLHDTFEKQAREIVDTEASRLRQRYDDLHAEVRDLTEYKRREIAWVCAPNVVDSISSLLGTLSALGLQNVSVVTPEPARDFQLGDPDLVILSFDGTSETRRLLRVVVERLKSQSPPVPLLIYTFSSEGKEIRLDTSDFSVLAGFDWYVPVNFPAQLIAQAQLLIRRSKGLLGGSHG